MTLTLTLTLGRARAEKISVQAIREGRTLEDVAAGILAKERR